MCIINKMIKKFLIVGLIVIVLISCNTIVESKIANDNQSTVQVVGAMKNVMWKGELAGTINLDTIKNKKSLYGLGPVEYLSGEILIIDGKTYVSKVLTDSTMTVEENHLVKAPFLVYTNQTEWDVVTLLPLSVHTIKDLEKFIDNITLELKSPFVFKLSGQVENAEIHIQNLPKGTKVSSPEEAHQGQTSYFLKNIEVDIVGFFSTEHTGIFTHHDSNVHMHLITADRKKMGHLDKVIFGNGTIKLYLPKK